MSNKDIEARLDKLLERVSGGAHQSVALQPDREVARMVKRTEVATTSQKQNVVKFIVIGIAIILLLVAMIYFVAKTKYGKGIRDMMGGFLGSVGKSNKKRSADIMQEQPSSQPRKVLVAEEVDLRSHPKTQRPSPNVPVTVRVPRIPAKHENEHLDPGAVPFRRNGAKATSSNQPNQPPVQPIDPIQQQQQQRPRPISPPIEDKGPAPPPELIDSSSYKND